MKVFHIVQLNNSKYTIFDENFNKLSKDGKVLSDVYKKEQCIITLGNTEIFIKKNPGIYFTYLKFSVPQLKRTIEQYAKEIEEK